jgi:hypothetical protein
VVGEEGRGRAQAGTGRAAKGIGEEVHDFSSTVFFSLDC